MRKVKIFTQISLRKSQEEAVSKKIQRIKLLLKKKEKSQK
jgi:hypothetical protein